VLPLRLLRPPRNGVGTVGSGRPDEERTPART
jgi:hypothetical protein